jgi:hypothetical protein
MNLKGLFIRLLIFCAFYINTLTTIIFAISWTFVAITSFIVQPRPLIIDYIFWFSLGAFIFSMIYRQAFKFLQKKYKKEDQYYLQLLNKAQKKSNHLKVTHKKEAD